MINSTYCSFVYDKITRPMCLGDDAVWSYGEDTWACRSDSNPVPGPVSTPIVCVTVGSGHRPSKLYSHCT